MNIFKNIFSKGAKELIDAGRGLIDEIITSKEEREKLKIEFQKIANDHAARMEELSLKAQEIGVQDRSTARTRETEFVKATGHVDYLMWFLAIAAIAIFAFLVWSAIKEQVPDDNRELVFHIFGIVEGVLLSIFSYYFGSSAGSRIKDMKK